MTMSERDDYWSYFFFLLVYKWESKIIINIRNTTTVKMYIFLVWCHWLSYLMILFKKCKSIWNPNDVEWTFATLKPPPHQKTHPPTPIRPFVRLRPLNRAEPPTRPPAGRPPTRPPACCARCLRCPAAPDGKGYRSTSHIFYD